MTGVFSEDTIVVANKTISKQLFSEISDEQGLGFAASKFDGIFGLGYRSLAVQNATPPIYNMYFQGLIDKAIVSFYLTKMDGAQGGEVIFGGSDPKYYTPPMYYAPIVNRHFWQFNLDTIRVGGKSHFCQNGCSAIADTGTSLITGPAKDVAALNILLGGELTTTNDTSFDCNKLHTLPHVSFIVKGHPLTITANDYVVKVRNNNNKAASTY